MFVMRYKLTISNSGYQILASLDSITIIYTRIYSIVTQRFDDLQHNYL